MNRVKAFGLMEVGFCLLIYGAFVGGGVMSRAMALLQKSKTQSIASEIQHQYTLVSYYKNSIGNLFSGSDEFDTPVNAIWEKIDSKHKYTSEREYSFGNGKPKSILGGGYSLQKNPKGKIGEYLVLDQNGQPLISKKEFSHMVSQLQEYDYFTEPENISNMSDNDKITLYIRV